ncbi:MAG: ABC transporter permease [Spirochaetales bacterium]|nr:ABC transporter permease [Spirochaetales bacterium]
MASYNLNEVLKNKKKESTNSNGEIKLDDVSRVKVLSPTMQVFKRFIRNRLAVFGSVVIIILFVFCFIGPFLYPYGQKQTFYKYDSINVKFGVATENTSFTGYVVDSSINVDTNANSYMTTYIKEMMASGKTRTNKLAADGNFYQIDILGDNVVAMSQRQDVKAVATFGSSVVDVATYDAITRSVKYNGETLGSDFEKKVATLKGNSGKFTIDGVEYSFRRGTGKNYVISAAKEGFIYSGTPLSSEFEDMAENAVLEEVFPVGGEEYIVVADGNTKTVYRVGEAKIAKVFTTYVIDFYDSSIKVTDEFRNNALLSAYTTGKFTADGKNYTLVDHDDVLTIYDENGKEYGEFSNFIIRRSNGDDTIEYEAKVHIREAIEGMKDQGLQTYAFTTRLPQQTSDGQYAYDENGVLLYDDDSEVRVKQTDRNYELWANQVTYVIDRFASPSWSHILGTDGDGFDVFARVMYGGRVSLMVGFVVVFIELLIGVVMGGLAGYYGGWVDNIIMRAVDVFYCLPSMPIMIILGGIMDAMRMDVYRRLFIMMIALGIMGWAGVARLVRGQILSFREQEFMIAAEATGIKVKDRIFKHLIPNVMPQLIVSATMGIGGTILTESTLSFLGLGVKHPLATWGTMINSVSSASAMAHYAYIWIPVGLLISFTVIAFNFIGDGLRDAYDPKGKR